MSGWRPKWSGRSVNTGQKHVSNWDANFVLDVLYGNICKHAHFNNAVPLLLKHAIWRQYNTYCRNVSMVHTHLYVYVSMVCRNAYQHDILVTQVCPVAFPHLFLPSSQWMSVLWTSRETQEEKWEQQLSRLACSSDRQSAMFPNSYKYQKVA